MSGAPGGRRWRARPRLAGAVGLALRAVPVLGGMAAALGLARLLPSPVGAATTVLWWTAVVGTPLLVTLALGLVTRRLSPLPFLLRLSLVFPDRAPSRLAILRRTHRVRDLEEGLRAGATRGMATPTASMILALVTALTEHDRATRGHSERVRIYAELIAEELGVGQAGRDRLRWAALIHDVGKLEVSSAILTKAGRPTEEEWEELRGHPDRGLELAGPLVPWLGEWSGAISQHHERYDGTGYPRGLSGQEISLAGRILGVADAYETMTASRPYSDPVRPADARRELVACSGSQFDPTVVRAFLNVSLGRMSWRAALLAWAAQVPLVALVRAVPARARGGAATTAGVVAMAAAGLVGPLGPVSDDGAPTAGGPPQVGGEPESEGASGAGQAAGPAPGGAEQPAGPARGLEPLEADRAGGPGPGPADPSTAGPSPLRPLPGGGGTDPGVPPRRLGEDAEVLATTRLYLRAPARGPTRRHHVMPLSGRPPPPGPLPNHDSDVDDRPGLLLARGARPAVARARWGLRAADPGGAVPLDLTVWARAADGRRAAVGLEARVESCDQDAARCRPVARGAATSPGARGGWTRLVVPLEPGADVGDGVLLVTLTGGTAGGGPVVVAFGTARYPAALGLGRARGPDVAAVDVAPTSPPDPPPVSPGVPPPAGPRAPSPAVRVDEPGPL